ncbi:hypothetical protein D3C81_1095620 [compost metagenome]
MCQLMLQVIVYRIRIEANLAQLLQGTIDNMRMCMPHSDNSVPAIHIQIGLLLMVIYETASRTFNLDIQFFKYRKWFHQMVKI